MKDQEKSSSPNDGISPVSSRQALTELTRNQLLVWLGQQLVSELPVYNKGVRFCIQGDVDERLFQKAWHAVVAGSDCLRATISKIDDAVVMQVTAEHAAPLKVLDLGDERNNEKIWWTITQQIMRVPLDGGQPLAQAILARLSEKQSGFFLAMHQIVSDAWTFAELWRRLQSCYQALSLGREPDNHYTDFRQWCNRENAYLDSPQGRRSAQFWADKLVRTPPPLSFYGSRPQARGNRVHRIKLPLTQRQKHGLMALSTRPEFGGLSSELSMMSLCLTLLAAWSARISASREFYVGLVLPNRAAGRTAHIAGLLMTISPISIAIRDDETYKSLYDSLLADVRECIPHARYANANSPHRRIYDVLLHYQCIDYTDFAGLSCHGESMSSGFDLDAIALQVVQSRQHKDIQLYLDLNADLFAVDMQAKVLCHWQAMIEALLANPMASLQSVDLLTRTETAVLESLTVDAMTDTAFIPVNDSLEAIARRFPHSTAVYDHGRHLSYAALVKYSRHMANQLHHHGLGAESVVAVHARAGLELVVSIVAILRAGCVFLPLDTTDPEQRKRSILQQASPSFLLHDEGNEFDSTGLPCKSLSMVQWLRTVSDEGTGELAFRVHGEMAATIQFTTGSTGEPLGVVISQRSLSAMARNMGRQMALGRDDRVLQLSPIHCDTLLTELFPTLIAGACLVIGGADYLASPKSLLNRVRSLAVTVVHLPSFYWHVAGAMLGDTKITAPVSLRTLVIGGEQARVGAWYGWARSVGHGLAGSARRHGPVRLINSYGATEATVVVSAFGADLHTPSGGQIIPIGRPLPGIWMRNLTPILGHVPPGVAGECHLGGPCLARAYLGRPALTAERFIPHPYSHIPGRRLFKTGDWIRLNHFSDWEFVGRRDRRIEYQGYRVDLDGIENRLCAIDGIDAAAVYVAANGELYARFVSASLNVAQVRERLRRDLPNALVPPSMSVVTALPCNDRGNIDYALLANQSQPRTDGYAYGSASPSNEQHAVAMEWSRLLGLPVERMGVDDNFFVLGGHSLLGATLMARLEQRFCVELPLRVLYDSPSIRALSAEIAQRQVKQVDDEVLACLLKKWEGLGEGG